MPLQPGERYTSIEVDTMKQLGHTEHRLKLYETLRKTETNPNILLAVGAIKMLNFSLKSENNQIEAFEGDILMEDIQTINRDLDREEENVISLSNGALSYLLAHVVGEQYCTATSKRSDVFVFSLNTCEIHSHGVIRDDFQKLKDNFNLLVRTNRPTDIYKKKYLLFPVSFRAETYCTLVVNPHCAVVKLSERGDDTCTMVHIGTKNCDEYKALIVPKIMKLLWLFMDLYRPAAKYVAFMEDAITVREKVLPKLPYYEKAFQLAVVFERLLGKEYTISGWENAIESLGTGKPKMRAEIKELRKVIGEKIYVKVMMGSNKVASHLLEKRRRIGEHQKKQREDAAIKRPSDCDEYDEPKSKIQKIEKTENKQ
ncbi:DDE-1 domain-containing protein [Caenorhabditis elegans]|uniref:DDE-1 domain-containing protein n=1 Tax=Caenorhabditis elegans TaxID=6239 RepID=Q9XWT0_CAEEL|nr:DDE-1 domain-containing protein [Caenorhabditis elegans]CAA21565.1 DDE-1 domain-containing protein [Caenorhabditis elegans]|eukprot:NP_509990.1 Uncharacterized protein CELE_Y62H9A.9 [Caenorhabditis elegans]